MLKVGLYGYQIWLHAIAYAQELQKSKSVRIVSVFDEDLKQAQRLGEAAGGTSEVKVYTDPDKFADSGIDFAILTGLPSKRIEAVKKLAPRKIHLLIDKPISSTSADAAGIINICRQENVKLMVGYNLHRSKSLLLAKKTLNEGSLGKPLCGFYAYDGPMIRESEWSTKPGWRMDKKQNMSVWFTHADHGIDVFMWLFEADYTDVCAQMQNLANPGYDSYDWGTSIFSMDNGAKVVIKSDAITPPELEILNIRIICEKGGIVFDYFPTSKLEIFHNEPEGGKVMKYEFKDDINKALAEMAEEFASYITDNTPVPKYCSGEIAGYRLLKAAETAHSSSDLNKKLKINYEIL